ncbi:MAG: DNA-directed DNA polymerase II small subunit [Candidatus Poseidoniia archaeon]|nr:DNA-directed DNA polymerase II small subunit [Candidatus Poseidoniia archaeon]
MVVKEKEIIDWLSERKLMPSPELITHISNHPDGLVLLEKSVASLDGPKLFLSVSDLLIEDNPEPPKPISRPKVADIPPIIIERQIDKSMADGKLQSFVSLFNDRFTTLSRLVRRNPSMRDAGPLSTLNPDEENQAIGMIAEIQSFPNGRTKVVIEDKDNRINIMLKEEEGNPLNLLNDEVIGVSGKLNRQGNLLYVNSPIVRPHLGRYREVARSEEPYIALFISDIHLGSGTFKENEWNKFISWLNGEVDYHKEWIPDPGYLVIAGDAVDGIDSYPGQEDDLSITDVWEQYSTLSKSISKIPNTIQTVIMPGNHDAVRLMEPQLPLPDRVIKDFGDNLTFTANPVLLNLAGVQVLCYHGKSLDDLVSLRDLTYDNPMSMMKELLNRRHMAPVYGAKTPLAPEKQDHMLIREVPDIFVTGHVHSFGIERYNGVLMLNPGTWQAQTDYQKMMGFQPQPCRAVAVNLQTFDTQVLDFNF